MKKPKFDPKRPLSSRHRPPSVSLGFGNARWRLFGLVFGVLFVIKMAETAGDPRTWNWLFSNSTRVEPQAKFEPEPNSKLPFQPSATHYDPPGTFVSAAEKPLGATLVSKQADVPTNQPIDASAVPQEPHDALESAWKEAWRDIFPRLANEDRALIYRALKSARDEVPLTEKFRPPLLQLLETLDRTWTGYQAEATGTLNDLSDEEKSAWLDVLRRIAVRWTDSLAPAFKAVAEGQTPNAEQQAALQSIQTLLDGLLLAAVKDDSVWRTGEAEIWFRLIERIRVEKPGDPVFDKAPVVSYIQLFKQSNAYRGETVKVRGNVREAWHIKANENWCGVEGYYVFVLKPPEATSPIFIYALELPPGFPPINDLDKDGEPTILNEEIEFTGIFFKRWAYPAKEGSYSAPLLIAKVATWSPVSRPFRETVTPENWRSLLTLAICLCGALSIGLALIWRMQFRRNSHIAGSDDLSAELRALEKLPTGPSVKDRLRDLEQHE